jgi:predicted glycosyltransferase
MAAEMRVVFYSVNDMGLGHLRRSAAIMVHLRSLVPEIAPLMVTNAHFQPFLESLNVPAVVLPRPKNGPRNRPDQLRARIDPELFDELSLRTIGGYRPDLVVFDTYVGSKLLRGLAALEAASCLVYRKCRPSSFVQQVRGRYFSAFDSVIVPHTEPEFKADLPVSVVSAFENQTRVSYVGPVIFPAGDHRPQLRRSEDERIILLLGGGGGYDASQSRFFACARRAAQLYTSASPSPARCLTIVGPFAHPPAGVDVDDLIISPLDVLGYIGEADLVISHGGYNSVNEVLASGARAIFCPFYRATEDQRERLERLLGRSATALAPPDVTEVELVRIIDALLAEARPEPVSASGGLHAAQLLSDQLLGGETGGPGEPPVRCKPIEVEWAFVSEVQDHPLLPFAPIFVWLGQATNETLLCRAQSVCETLERFGVAVSEVYLSYSDPGEGEQLPSLVKSLLAHRFKRVTAHIAARDTSNPKYYFILEECRRLKPMFDFEISPATGEEFWSKRAEDPERRR